MGFLSSLFAPKTKAMYDNEIACKERHVAQIQANLVHYKNSGDKYNYNREKQIMLRMKGEIAALKAQRRSAPN